MSTPATLQRTSRICAQPSCNTLFSLGANGWPVNQGATRLSKGAGSRFTYSDSSRTFSSFLLVAAMAEQVSANAKNESSVENGSEFVLTGSFLSFPGFVDTNRT